MAISRSRPVGLLIVAVFLCVRAGSGKESRHAYEEIDSDLGQDANKRWPAEGENFASRDSLKRAVWVAQANRLLSKEGGERHRVRLNKRKKQATMEDAADTHAEMVISMLQRHLMQNAFLYLYRHPIDVYRSTYF